jgi:hypothetical protein
MGEGSKDSDGKGGANTRPQKPKQKPAAGASTQTPQSSGGQSSANTQLTVIPTRSDDDPAKPFRRKSLGKITTGDLAKALENVEKPQTSAKGANTQPEAKASDEMEVDQPDDLYPDAMAELEEEPAGNPLPTTETASTSQKPIAEVLTGALYPLTDGCAPEKFTPELQAALGEQVMMTDERSILIYPVVFTKITAKFPSRWPVKRPTLKDVPGYTEPTGPAKKEGVWPIFYEEPARNQTEEESRLELIRSYEEAGLWSTPVDSEGFLTGFDNCSRAYCSPNIIRPLTIGAVNPPTEIRSEDNCIIQQTTPLRCYRKANGLTPTLFGAQRWCMMSKLDTYKAVPLKDHPGVFTCAPMHKPEYIGTDRKRIMLRKWINDFSANKSPEECVSLDASTLMRQISDPTGEKSFPNVWLKRERELTTRESLRDSDLKMLQLLIQFRMQDVNPEKEPYVAFPRMAYWGMEIKHPYLLALQLSTIPFSRAILLKTVAMIGYQNMELFQRSHEEYYSHFRSKKVVEALWYCNVVHAMLRNLLDEVLMSTQAEFINRAFIRKQWKALDSLISTPVNLYHLVQFVTTQEIHTSHPASGIFRNENNQYMAIAEGQVLPISVLQDICLNLITVYHHHAHCMLALYDVNSVAYTEHDRCFRLNVLDTQLILGVAYTYAATNSFLSPKRKIEIQRRLGWLQENPTLEGQGRFIRLMPMTCWVAHALEHNHVLTAVTVGRINEEDRYPDWQGTPAPILCRKEAARSAKKVGAIDQKVEEVAAEMGVTKPHPKDVVMKDVDYSSGEEYDAVVKDQEGAPEPVTAAAWTARAYARARPEPIKTDDVRRRTQVVEAQVGERALARISVTSHPIDSVTQNIDNDPTWIFAPRYLKDRIEQSVKTYQAEVLRGIEAYDSMFDCKQDTAPNFVKMRQHFTVAQRQINFLSTCFLSSPEKEKARRAAEYAVHISAPFTHTAGSVITIRWEMWFLIRSDKSETWMDTTQKKVANIHWNGVLESYQICSQKYHVAAVSENSFKRYRQAINTIPFRPENRRFYVPDDADLWRCKDCRSDLRSALHKDYCWHMCPSEPKAIIAYKRGLTKAIGGTGMLTQLEQFHQARVQQARKAIDELKLPQEELIAMARNDLQLADLLETAYPGSLGKHFKQASVAPPNPNQPGPAKRQSDNRSLDGEPKGKPPKESKPSTSTVETPSAKNTAQPREEWQKVQKKGPKPTSTARSKSRPARAEFAKARGGATSYRGGFGRGARQQFGHSTEAPLVPYGRAGQPRFNAPGFALSTSYGGRQYHPSQNAVFLAKQEQQQARSKSQSRKKKRGSRGARSGRDDTQDEEDSEDDEQ